MFVDASAIVAMLGSEAGSGLAARLEAAPNRMTAPPCILAAVEAIADAGALPPAAVFALVERFLEAISVRTVSLPAALAAPAAAILDRHGRRSERSGGLSGAQALALAAARYYRLPLLHDDPALARVAIAG